MINGTISLAFEKNDFAKLSAGRKIDPSSQLFFMMLMGNVAPLIYSPNIYNKEHRDLALDVFYGQQPAG